MAFTVGRTYTREQVQDLLNVPIARRDGQWRNGYPKFEGQFYIFCNVGMPGRSGPNYQNAWDGNDLIWFGRSTTSLKQPVMREIASGDRPIHVFWRSDSAKPQFNYRGLGRALTKHEIYSASCRSTTPTHG